MWWKEFSVVLLLSWISLGNCACYGEGVCERNPWLKCCKEDKEERGDNVPCGEMKYTRIYNGSPASEGELPWMAVLYYQRRNEPHCGATVISQKYLLTAAHCVTGEIVKKFGEP